MMDDKNNGGPTDNYNPTGMADASLLRLETEADCFISGPSTDRTDTVALPPGKALNIYTTDGKIYCLKNNGSVDIYLVKSMIAPDA
jgi:hypothetical protein